MAPNFGVGVGARIPGLLAGNPYFCMLNSPAPGEPLENQSEHLSNNAALQDFGDPLESSLCSPLCLHASPKTRTVCSPYKLPRLAGI